MDDLSKIKWHDVQDKSARIDDVEFLSGDLTGTDLSGIEWQDAKPVTQSVLDVRDKKTYNVPVAMDGVDATFAIDTQLGGKDKRSFFGKVWYTMDLVADAMEETIQSAERGGVGFAGQLADTALFYAYDVKGLREKIEKLENYDASKYEKVLEKDNIYYHNLTEEQRLEKLERAKNMLDFVTNLREKVGNKISAAQNILRPQEKMDKIDEYAEAVGNGVTSVGASIASLLATKNPEFSAGLMALSFGSMRNKEVFEKAIEQGYDYNVADFYGDIAGTIEGSIEIALEPVFYAVGNLTPMKKLTNELIAGGVSKLASKGSKSAAKKIVSRHTQGVLPAALKSFVVEGSEEGLQESLGMEFENLVGLEDYSGGDILSQTLVSMTVGGLTGSGAAVVGTTSYNAKVEEDNARIVRAVQKEYPDMTPEETQQTADALQEMFYQEENKFVGEFQKLLEKEAEPDALPEGLTREQVTRETREILKEKYQMTDEQIDKTIDFALLSIDLRNQFNEAYTHFREGLEKAGRKPEFADGEARILAARALTLAKASKTNVKDVMDRWALRFEESQGAQNQRQAAEKVLGDKKEIASMAFKLINRKKGIKDERLSLSAFIKKHGGLKDVGGDLKNMDAQKQYVGLINNQAGMSLDDMAQLAWESGYLKTAERPDVNQLLEAIDSDLRGSKVYADEKSADQLEDESLESWQQAFDEAGVDLKNDNINTIYRKMKAYQEQIDVQKLEAKLTLDEKNQERIAILEENGLTHREALEQLEKERLLKESLDDEIPLFQESLDLQEKISKIDDDRLAFERKDINPELKGRENEIVKPVKIDRVFTGKKSSAEISFDDILEALDKTVEKNANGKRILKNSVTGETATLSNKSLDKMFNTTTIPSDENIGGILGKECIAHIAEIFDTALLIKTHDDIKHGSKNKIRRYANVVQSQKDTDSPVENFIVKITVKELANGSKDLTDIEIESNGGKELAAYDLKVGRKNTAGNPLGNFAKADKAAVAHNGGNDIIINDLIDFVNTYTEKSIEINGVNRSALNSNGERIAKTAEGLQAFYEWFGDSKVVDKDGRPLVVYHGTNADFDTFDIEKAQDKQYKKGFFFTADKAAARMYGDIIMPVYLKAETDFYESKKTGKPIDYIHPKNDSRDIWIVFNPGQIKSVYNVGAFGKENHNIYYQGGYTPDLFSFNNQAQANVKPVPLMVKKEVNDLFAWAEKENATQKDFPMFSNLNEQKKIEKTYKQSDDSIEDVGDSLLGNLKRNKKVYTWEELEGMNDLMRQRYLSKQYVYPAPLFDELKAQGLSDRGAALVLYVYSKINSKPAKGYDNIEDQKLYYDFVNRAMAAVIDFTKNNEALIDSWDRYNLNLEVLNAIFPPEPGQRGSVFRTNKTFNREALVAGGNRLVRGLQLSGSDLEEIDKIAKLAGKKEEASDEQSKEKKKVWEKYFQVCKNWNGTYFIGDKKGRVYSRDLSFKTVEEATAFAEKLYEKILPYLNTGGDVVSFAGMREGTPRRENNENVDAQGLMDTFGFRGINFGNWTKQSERQEFLNNTYDSLVDLAELLNLPLRALSLEGKLGLAFGAQGVGKAAGHFIPAYNEINLTRKQGAGTLAHEWWHALDYYFGNLSQGKDFSGKAILELDKDENLRSELFAAFQNLKDKIKNKALTEEELKKRQKLYEEEQERKIAWRAKTIKAIFARASYAEEIASLVDEIVAKGKNFDYAADNEKYRVKFENLIEKKRQTLDNFAHIVGLLHDMDCYAKIDEISHHWKRSTEYYENAKKLNRIAKGMGVGYWTEETELGARAFSSYILEQIRKQSLKNDFLVRNEEKYDRHLDEDALAEEFMKRETQENKEPIKIVDFLVPAYPSNVDERTSIFNAFDHLFDVMNVNEAENYRLYQNSNNPRLPNNPRGGYKNGIIYLFENNDASTVIHELGHFFLDDMRKFSDDPETSAQLEAVYNYLGSKDGNLTREQHELFADSFEVYLLDGRSPNTLLSKVFARFKRWIGAIYGEVKRLNKIKISDDIKTVFDEMLGGRSLDFAMQTNAAQMADNLQNGQIPPAVVNRALDLLTKGKMSRADMDEILDKLKTGELKRKEVAEYLKKFENSNNIHHEALNPFDKVKYKSALQKGNFNKKEVKDKIERLLKWSEPKMQGGKLVGKFPNLQLNRHFDHVRELYNTEKYQAREKIADNIKLINAIIKGEEVGDTTQLAFDNKILSIAAGRADASLLLEVYSALSDSYNLGRISSAITGQAKKMRKQRLIMEAYDVLTDSARVDDRKEKMKFIQGLNRLGLSMVSWNGLLDILSMNDKSSKAGMSVLSKEMDVFDVEQKEAQGIADDGEHVSRLIEKKLKSNNNPAISLQRYVNTKLKEKFTLEWGDNKKTFTKDQLLDIYMKSFDEETRKMMMEDPVAQYNLEFLQQVKELIDEDDAAVVDALFEFYDENYHKINAFYEDKYGTSLGKRAFYSPRSMDRGGINVDTGDAASYAGFSGVKQRTAKAGAIKPKGAFDVLQNYIVNSNHWIAWADKLIDINAVFGDVRIKNIIRNLWGVQMEKRIAYEVSRMASNDKFQSKFGYSSLFNKIRANYATSALALKPALAIKQLTSFPAYWEKMSTADFLAGIADFIAHPKQAIEILGQTTLMKTRGVNIIKDFEQLSKTELIKNKANKIKLRELMMFNIKFGDRGAIYMGGWALYKAELKKNLKAGLSEEEAKQKALQTFEKVTDETQQSGRLSEQSYWQSNPFLRAFTMFQSSQNQYLRKEISAVRGLMTGRMDKGKVLKTLFIYHVLLPCFFQAVADGFRWDKDAQLRAALLGSLNGVFILNSVLEKLYDAYIGGKGLWNSSLRIRDVVPFWGSGEDLIKFFDDLSEGDVELDDYIDVMRAFGKPVGELTGLPVKYPLDVIKNFGEYAEDDEMKKEVLLWLGWSPYALRDLED